MSLAVLLLFRAQFGRDTPDFTHPFSMTLWKTKAAKAKTNSGLLGKSQRKKYFVQCDQYLQPVAKLELLFRESVLLCTVLGAPL